MSLSSSGNQQHQPLNPQSYHLPSYQDYVQNNVYNHPPGPAPAPGPLEANFGSYGQNIGTMDWSDLNRRSKKNRRMIGLAAGLFILFALVTGGNSSTYKSDSSGANDGSGNSNGNGVANHVVSTPSPSRTFILPEKSRPNSSISFVNRYPMSCRDSINI